MVIFAVEKWSDGKFVWKKFKDNTIVLDMEPEAVCGPFDKLEDCVDELDNFVKEIRSDREINARLGGS